MRRSIIIIITVSVIGYSYTDGIAKDTSTATKKKVKKGEPYKGTIMYDADGNPYRHGFQYAKDRKKIKPTGKVQYDTYTDEEGTKHSDGYSWGFQYGSGQKNTLMKRLKTTVKTQKYAKPPKEDVGTLEFAEPETEKEQASTAGAKEAPATDSKSALRKQIMNLIRKSRKKPKK